MKKRITAIVMSLIMAMSVISCTKEQVEPSVEASVSAEVSAEEKVEKEVIENIEKTVEVLADDTSKDTPDVMGGFVDAEGNPAEKNAEGTVYLNEFFGYKVVPADGYFFLSDEADAYVENATAEFFEGNDDSLSQEIASDLREESAAGFYLTEESELHTINTQIDYVGPLVNEGNLDAMLDETIKQMEAVFAGDTVKDLNFERSTVSFMGKDMPCIKGCIKMEMQGVTFDFNMLSITLVKDGYICTFSFGSYLDDKCAELTEMVLPLE